MLNFTRIAPYTDIPKMQCSTVTVAGCGGGAGVIRSLVRSGLGHVNLVDFDRIEGINICRQEHMYDTIGQLKVDALASELRRIDPTTNIKTYARDFCSFTDDEIDDYFGDTDVFLFCVDNLAANARGNEVALRRRTPAVWSGLYPGGRAGEIALWTPEFRSCYRCLCGARYEAATKPRTTDVQTESADVFSVQYIDSLAGMVVVSLLTRGAANPYGRLIDTLVERQTNFLQVKIDPDWTWKGRDLFREQLQVPADCSAYLSFVTIARSDPDHGEPPCPDCVKFLGRGFNVVTP